MKYKTKSMLVSRTKNFNKGENEFFPYNIQVKFFEVNDPHKLVKNNFKFQILEFKALSAYFKDFKECKFLPWGNDLLFNDLTEVDVEFRNDRIFIKNLSRTPH